MVWCRKRIFDNNSYGYIHSRQLWFGVEKGYLTTDALERMGYAELWFGVEKGYLTTEKHLII